MTFDDSTGSSPYPIYRFAVDNISISGDAFIEIASIGDDWPLPIGRTAFRRRLAPAYRPYRQGSAASLAAFRAASPNSSRRLGA